MTTRLGTGLLSRGPLGRFAGRYYTRPLDTGLTGIRTGTVSPGGDIGSYAGRGIFVAPSQKVAGSFTRLRAGAISRGPLGNFLGRISIAPTLVVLPTTHFIITPKPFSVLQDMVINLPAAADESFTGGATFSVGQSGSAVDLPVGHFTLTPNGAGFSVIQANANDHDVFLPTGHLTLTPKPFTVAYENSVALPTGRMPFTGLPFDISITLPGPQTLTQTDILAIWGNIIISGRTPRDILRIIGASAAGQLLGAKILDRGVISIRSIDGTEEVILAEYDEAGNRVKVTIDP